MVNRLILFLVITPISLLICVESAQAGLFSWNPIVRLDQINQTTSQNDTSILLSNPPYTINIAQNRTDVPMNQDSNKSASNRLVQHVDNSTSESNIKIDTKNMIKDNSNDSKTIEDLRCLALNIYFEARGEPEIGRLAVGHVVQNRIIHSRFPSSACKVVRQGGEQRRNHCQFSWWCDGRADKPTDRAAWQNSLQLAYKIYLGESQDPTGGALWYHADYVNPYWKKAFVKGPKIGRHIFYQQHNRSNLVF